MTPGGRYERQCRWLLAAFPPDFRQGRTEEMVSTLLDDAPPGARTVPARTAAKVLVAGLRTRAVYAGAGPRVWGGVAGGIEMTAVVALGLQAAVAIAAAAYFARYGAIFWLFDEFHQTYALGAGSEATWVAVAAACWGAFLLAIAGRRKLAALLSGLATGYLLAVVGMMIHTDAHTSIIGASVGGEFSLRYGNLVATPGLVGIAVVATGTSVVAAIRGGRKAIVQHRAKWFAVGGVAILGFLFAAGGDGNALTGSPPILNPFGLPNGGILDTFEYLWFLGAFGAVLWSLVDPRPGWVMVVMTVPTIAYSVSALTIGRTYYAIYGSSGWWLARTTIMIGVAVAVLVIIAIRTSRHLSRVT